MGKTGVTCRRVLAAVALLSAVAGTGCAVSDSDVHRWETTEGGPEKLYAIVTHDKYSWALREEAALSLVHMRPRSGKRIGLEYLVLGFEGSAGKVPAALSVLTDESRKHIVDDIAPKLIDIISQPPPAKTGDGTTVPPDPSIPYKDAAFGMLSHEPPLVSDDKTKADITAALTSWVQTDFEDRIDNSSQQFGVEQIMRAIGPTAVKGLPASIVEGNTKNDKACQLIADIGDDDTKTRAGQALVALMKTIDSPTWVEKQRALVNEANKKQGTSPTAAQVAAQLSTYQEQELEKVFTNMKRVGGRPVVDFCLAYAQDKSKSEKMRSDALAALENRMDKNFPGDVTALFNIVGDDTAPDAVRGVAMARAGELPKELILPKLYALFTKKWQVRLDAAKLVLKTMTPKDVPSFMAHLPTDPKTKMSLNEPITYGLTIMNMDPGTGPKPRDVLNQFLSSSSMGAKLTAAGSYYQGLKKDAAAVVAIDGDKAPLPKCDDSDKCGWECYVGKDKKEPATVGDFVKYCIEPQLK